MFGSSAARASVGGQGLARSPGDFREEPSAGQAQSPQDGGGGAGAQRPMFETFTNRDVVDLIAEYPLAWVCARGGKADHASLLPLLAETGEDGRVTRLIGHMARRNPLWAELERDPAALILFQGPQAYVSPSVVGQRDWVPTWNYAQLRIEADIRFLPSGGDAALELLVDAMESSQEDPWRVEETGPRYRGMEQRIIAFDADVTVLRGRFKLGQDETPETLRSIVANHPDSALVRWIRRFNEGRI